MSLQKKIGQREFYLVSVSFCFSISFSFPTLKLNRGSIWLCWEEKKKKIKKAKREKDYKNSLVFNFLISQYKIDEVEGKKDDTLQSPEKYLTLTG